VMKDVTQLIWATYIFGIYGDIVEGDIDDDVNSKTGKKSSGDTNPLPSDPSSFAAWTKDTTFAVMLSARIAKYVEDYVSSIDPALISLIISHNNNNTDDGRPHPSYRAVQYYYHTKSGAFDNLEALKRTTFDTWGLDTGLLRGIMQHIVIPHYNYINSDVMSIGDLGAGGGHYSQWFNNTGIVYAYAFDGINDITNVMILSVLLLLPHL
ncbi:hypothetical protein FOZ63_012553, partial [Perkinsus olseni]